MLLEIFISPRVRVSEVNALEKAGVGLRSGRSLSKVQSKWGPLLAAFSPYHGPFLCGLRNRALPASFSLFPPTCHGGMAA